MKKKILFVNDEMMVGGVSKVLNNLLALLDKNKFDIDLLILHYHGDMIKEIPNGINVIRGTAFFNVCDTPISDLLKDHRFILLIKKICLFFSIKTGLITYLIRHQRNKMHIEDYDAEIAFKEGFCTLFVASGDCPNKINWIHADYKVKNYAANYMATMKKCLSKIDHNIAVSQVAANSFQEVFSLTEKVQTIHNIIKYEDIINKSAEMVDFRDDKLTFVSVGRLHPQKAYDRLINVCSRLKKEGYLFKLYIIGDGEQKESLMQQIADTNLANTVILLGQQSNPFKYLKQADCFVLSSIYEGMPTVVFESLILHVPVISTKVAGIDEQLNDHIGMIVDNSFDGLYDGLKHILDEPLILKKYQDNLFDYHYDNQKILNEVENLFD